MADELSLSKGLGGVKRSSQARGGRRGTGNPPFRFESAVSGSRRWTTAQGVRELAGTLAVSAVRNVVRPALVRKSWGNLPSTIHAWPDLFDGSQPSGKLYILV